MAKKNAKKQVEEKAPVIEQPTTEQVMETTGEQPVAGIVEVNPKLQRLDELRAQYLAKAKAARDAKRLIQKAPEQIKKLEAKLEQSDSSIDAKIKEYEEKLSKVGTEQADLELAESYKLRIDELKAEIAAKSGRKLTKRVGAARQKPLKPRLVDMTSARKAAFVRAAVKRGFSFISPNLGEGHGLTLEIGLEGFTLKKGTEELTYAKYEKGCIEVLDIHLDEAKKASNG
jgi:chromosome segregation ATPase